jgi:hypothetical protein
MPPVTPETVESFHSKDFRYRLGDLEGDPKIAGKTQAEWEASLDAVGAIEHLKGLGWTNYQWRYVAQERIDKNVVEFGHRMGCFAEFFSPHYHGYLRGDGDTVATAILVCLNRAQKMAQCEIRVGHKYIVPPKYTNGFVRCELCGFNGFTPQVQSLESTVGNLKIHIKVLQEQNIQTEEAIRKAGLRWAMKDFMGTLERIPKEKKVK